MKVLGRLRRPADLFKTAPRVAEPARPEPRCSACRRPLESRTPPPGSMLPPMYAAVVCPLCAWVECRDCKGSPSDAPCSVCGSPVFPARTELFA